MRAVLVAAAVLVFATPALARKPEDVYGGKILLSDKAYPSTASSPSAYTSAVKRQSKDRFGENKEKKEWKVYYAAFFKKPVNDLEITLKTYDITQPGSRRLIESYEQFMGQRGQRVMLGNLKFKKGEESGYQPNSKVLLIFESNGKTIAQATMFLQGEGRKFTGKVDFDEDDTKGPITEGGTDEPEKKPEEKKDAPR